MARKKKVQQDEPRGDEWLATYSDTITLLLTFFVLLYSMATLDSQKMRQMAQAFQVVMSGQKADSIMEYDLYDGQVPLIGGESPIEETIDGNEVQESMYFQVKKFVEEYDLSEVVDIINSERGIVIQLRDNILFETSSSSLRSDSKVVLDKISTLIGALPNNIIIEGHTDNRPINTSKFPSNWELSVDRAVNVVRYFVENKGLTASRFSASGYGEFQPVAPNDTAENMSRNRRVNILIMTTDGE